MMMMMMMMMILQCDTNPATNVVELSLLWYFI